MEAATQSPVGDARSQRLATQVESLVLHRLAADKLALPVFPAVAAKCLNLLKEPNFSFKDVGTVLEQDPVLAAKVVRLAGSAAFGGGNKVGLTQAATRLGAKTLRTVLIEGTAQKLFVSKDPAIAEFTKKLWLHSVAVASLARDVYALIGGKDQELAYLAGLLHDVGKPVVASILLEAERQIVEFRMAKWVASTEWHQVLSRTFRPVGVALAEKWNMPPEIGRCVKECSEFDPSDRGAVSNAVCFANALAKVSGFGVTEEEAIEAKPLLMIGRSLIGIEDQTIATMTATLGERVGRIYD